MDKGSEPLEASKVSLMSINLQQQHQEKPMMISNPTTNQEQPTSQRTSHLLSFSVTGWSKQHKPTLPSTGQRASCCFSLLFAHHLLNHSRKRQSSFLLLPSTYHNPLLSPRPLAVSRQRREWERFAGKGGWYFLAFLGSQPGDPKIV